MAGEFGFLVKAEFFEGALGGDLAVHHVRDYSRASTSLFLHQFEHCAGDPDHTQANCRIEHRRELARM